MLRCSIRFCVLMALFLGAGSLYAGAQGPPTYGDDPPQVREAIPLPDEKVVLTYEWERPTRYRVRGETRQGIRERPDLRQIFRSSQSVLYTPGEREGDARRISVHVESSTSEFVEPPELVEDRDLVRNIMDGARFSYAITGQGKIQDIQLDSPGTNPLARASLTQMAEFAQTMQPVFPTHALGPGDEWEQSFTLRQGEGIAQYSADTTNRYRLKEFRHCRDSVCAFIEVEQQMQGAGRLLDDRVETSGGTAGQGKGSILFDIQRGEIVRTEWELRGQGTVRTKIRNADGQVVEGPVAEVLVEVVSAAERIDPLPASDPL